jgi:hypothetical protein
MEPNQIVEQPTQLPPTPPQPMSHPSITTQPNPSKFLTILLTLVVLISLSGLVYFYLQTQSLKQQLVLQTKPTPTISDTPKIQTSPTTDPTANWETYTNKDLHITFQYPDQFVVVEPAPGFLKIKNDNDPVAQAGISIETRGSGPYTTYSEAQSYFQDSFNVTETKNVGMWQIFQGIGKEGMLKGVEFRSGIIEYRGGALEMEVLADTEYIQYFDQILSTFKFTE